MLLAGLLAGGINAVVGSGTLVTFPVLVALGHPPVTATTSNAVGLVAGGFSGVWGYRRELAGQGRRLLALLPASVIGALVGALLLLRLPESAFEAVVPALVVLAVVLVLVQPALQRRVRRRTQARAASGRRPSRVAPAVLWVLTLLIGVYGGYFTAAQGILLVGAMGSLLVEDLQRLNATKNVLSTAVNLVAAVLYATVGADRVDWGVAALIAVSSLVGGFLGAHWGRLLPAAALRAVIVVLGVVALVRMAVTA